MAEYPYGRRSIDLSPNGGGGGGAEMEWRVVGNFNLERRVFLLQGKSSGGPVSFMEQKRSKGALDPSYEFGRRAGVGVTKVKRDDCPLMAPRGKRCYQLNPFSHRAGEWGPATESGGSSLIAAGGQSTLRARPPQGYLYGPIRKSRRMVAKGPLCTSARSGHSLGAFLPSFHQFLPFR